ncbi:hypothetical protein PAQ31011_02406 [Pandoraea aquatica]|uniref:HNH endonuclease n=1 Tax=Pandoraea aquatica TaxID=2508290 RepID=A0A5E4V1Y0_9BURK|nr:hypothetical protein PAQ31011_02406 [Pandoraea aquatica]
MLGTCALCQKNADLQDSHLIPKWAYRRACGVQLERAPAPVYVANGSAVLSNAQTKRHLLCEDCEQRFSKSEDYLASLTLPDGEQFKLFSEITRCDTPGNVLARLDRSEHAAHIAYFAASVMWRGCVMTGDCKLGLYESAFRQYLLGKASFPTEGVLSIALIEHSPDVDARGWVSEPTSVKVGMIWVHGFLLAGLAFRCWLGKAVPSKWQQISLTGPNMPKYVSILKPKECADFLAAAELAGTAKPRGKLAKSSLAGPC